MNELKTKVAALLRADTDLRTLLSKSATPWGIYFARPPEKPTFPLVTFKIVGGSTDDAGLDFQVRTLVLIVCAYSKTNTDRILERVKAILSHSVAFSGMTACEVIFIALESAGEDSFDPEFQAYVRSHYYRVWLTKTRTI